MERIKDPADPQGCPDAPAQGPTRLAEFIDAECVTLPGLSVLFRDFAGRFYAWLPAVERPAWTRGTIAAELDRLGIQRGTGSSNRQTIGNIDLRANRPQLVRVGTKLVRTI